MLATFKYLSTNQANHRLLSMTDCILFMAMNENSMRVQIVHLVTDFFSPSGITDEYIEEKSVGFHGDFIID